MKCNATETTYDLSLKMSIKTVEAAPRASALIEGMRDFGYSLETALADIIDNSITAEASTIQIQTEMFDSNPHIAILDDGVGMTQSELQDALRPGSSNPRDNRHEADLGRFGLGLKTASFSQCRRVTVVSRKNGSTAAARWDLDKVAESDQWLLELPEQGEIGDFANQLGSHGTAVIWEKLDRLIDDLPSESARASANLAIDGAIKHLSLVFHRFLANNSGPKKVDIMVNKRALEPFDPFCTHHAATIQSPIEHLVVGGSAHVKIQAFTLPHHSKVTAAEWERAAGPEGYVKNQGFYVYRSNRLIIHGTWFGLARQTELTKLCRVRIDLPNSLDAEWKIDVKKASAQPPRVVRDRLRSLVERLGATSKRIYTTRGTKLTDNNPMPVWIREQKDGKIQFAVNMEHPLIVDIKSNPTLASINAALSMIESSLPLDALLVDLGTAPEDVVAMSITEADLRIAVQQVLQQLQTSSVPKEAVDAVFEIAEPFRSNPEVTRRILDAMKEQQHIG